MQILNLMPPDYARNERAKRRLLTSSAILVAALLAMFGLARLMNTWVAERAEETACLEQKLSGIERSRAELAARAAELEQLAGKLSVIEIVNRNRRWSSYLAQVSKAASDEILLTRAQIRPSVAVPSEVGPAEAAVRAAPVTSPSGEAKEYEKSKSERLSLLLEGYALDNTDVTRFVAGLGATGIFEEVCFKGSQAAQINGVSLCRFELECSIRYGSLKHKAEGRALAKAEGGGR